jgi:hypothetical protein
MLALVRFGCNLCNLLCGFPVHQPGDRIDARIFLKKKPNRPKDHQFAGIDCVSYPRKAIQFAYLASGQHRIDDSITGTLELLRFADNRAPRRREEEVTM